MTPYDRTRCFNIAQSIKEQLAYAEGATDTEHLLVADVVRKMGETCSHIRKAQRHLDLLISSIREAE